MILSKLTILLTLGYASIEDLKSWSVHDKVFIYGLVIYLVFAGYTEGLVYTGSMIVQGLLGAGVGFLLKFAGRFGGADIWALALCSAMYPEILLFQVLAFLLIPMVIWVRFYSILNVWKNEGAPAIPGIMIGFLILLSYHGI